MSVELSIIVPTYNVRENIGVLIERIDWALRSAGINYKVVVVDDNLPDGTADYAEELARVREYLIRVVRRPSKLSLTSAVIDGVRLLEARS